MILVQSSLTKTMLQNTEFTPEIITAVKTKIAQLKPPQAGMEVTTDQQLLRCVRPTLPTSPPSWMKILSHTCDTCQTQLISVHPGNTPPEMKLHCDACNTFVTETECIGCIHCGVDVCLQCVSQVEAENSDQDDSG